MNAPTQTGFAALPLSPALLANLNSLGYTSMTPIQAQALPQVLAGRDLLAQAQTGSGKTAAFGIGLLTRLNPRLFGVQGLVLCPTRELADQVTQELRRLARATPNIKLVTLVGGTPIAPQRATLEYGAHIVVGTPGRVLAHVRGGSLPLQHVAALVLDEADRMLEMGFADEVDAIIKALPTKRQTLLFSATYPAAIEAMCAAVLRNPLTVRVDSGEPPSQQITQRFFEVQRDQRTRALVGLLVTNRPASCLVFCNTRQQTQALVDELVAMGFSARAFSGDLEQRDRDRVLMQFANGSLSILVATDVAARGIDIKELDAVINYELPHGPDLYVHRIGRTGRAGEKGLALSLFSPAEAPRITVIEDYTGMKVEYGTVAPLDNPGALDLKAAMVTVQLEGGRKDKIRPGDIVGALTAGGIAVGQVGKIAVLDNLSYIAVDRAMARQAVQVLNQDKVKGRRFKARRLD